MMQQRPVLAVKTFAKGFEKRPEDKALVEHYAANWGVLDPGLDNGFFNSRIIYAAQARSLYITRWQNVQRLGNAYSLLADTAAGFDTDTRVAYAAAQSEALNASISSAEAVKDTLSGLVSSRLVLVNND
jgi:hypothetical protein